MDASLVQRFIRLINKESKDGCWNWMGSTDMRGYGYFNFDNKTARAHRFSYELFTGKKIPQRKVIDHLCRNPSCVNPAHLEVVSHYENIMRGTGVGVKSANKTHCVRGHEFSPENTVYQEGRNGRIWRVCKICKSIRQKKWKDSLKEK